MASTDFSLIKPITVEVTNCAIIETILRVGFPAKAFSERSDEDREKDLSYFRDIVGKNMGIVHLSCYGIPPAIDKRSIQLHNILKLSVHDVAECCINPDFTAQERLKWRAYFPLFLRRDIEKGVAVINQDQVSKTAETEKAVIALMTNIIKFADTVHFLAPELEKFHTKCLLWIFQKVGWAQSLIEEHGDSISTSVQDFVVESAKQIGTRHPSLLTETV
jgi:hypothetical protein